MARTPESFRVKKHLSIKSMSISEKLSYNKSDALIGLYLVFVLKKKSYKKHS